MLIEKHLLLDVCIYTLIYIYLLIINVLISNICTDLIAIGNIYYNMIWYFIEGLLTAQDCLGSHSFEMKDHGTVHNPLHNM
jgi:hypothetical protein